MGLRFVTVKVLNSYEEIQKNRKDMDLTYAVDKAILNMPESFMIREFLMGNRAEVKNMCITEYNEAETMEMFKEEGKAEGRKEGFAEGENIRKQQAEKIEELKGELSTQSIEIEKLKTEIEKLKMAMVL